MSMHLVHTIESTYMCLFVTTGKILFCVLQVHDCDGLLCLLPVVSDVCTATH